MMGKKGPSLQSPMNHELHHPAPNLPSYHSQISAVAQFAGKTVAEIIQANEQFSLTELLCEAAKRKAQHHRIYPSDGAGK